MIVVKLLAGENKATSILVEDVVMAHTITHGPEPLRLHSSTNFIHYRTRHGSGFKRNKAVIHVEPSCLQMYRQGKELPSWVMTRLSRADKIKLLSATQRSLVAGVGGLPPTGSGSALLG